MSKEWTDKMRDKPPRLTDFLFFWLFPLLDDVTLKGRFQLIYHQLFSLCPSIYRTKRTRQHDNLFGVGSECPCPAISRHTNDHNFGKYNKMSLKLNMKLILNCSDSFLFRRDPQLTIWPADRVLQLEIYLGHRDSFCSRFPYIPQLAFVNSLAVWSIVNIFHLIS